MSDTLEQVPSVLVMMATYNGEKYVSEQIDSILVQEGVNVTLLISDDGSSDATPRICSRYAEDLPNVRFSVNEKNKGLAKNFMDMLYSTMVFNSAFASVLQQYIPEVWPRIHDGWAHLVARALNAQVPDLGNAYIKRRISGQNQVGERGLGSLRLKRIAMMPVYLFFKDKNRHWAARTAAELAKGYSWGMDEECRALCSSFVSAESSFAKRLRLAFDPRFKSPYVVENALYPIKMILNKY